MKDLVATLRKMLGTVAPRARDTTGNAVTHARRDLNTPHGRSWSDLGHL